MKNEKARIIERTFPDGTVKYYIQKKCLWWWYEVFKWNAEFDMHFIISFKTLEEARQNLCYFDGTQCIDTVVE